jgi:DNA-binding NarL/FixJ family response regulator
VLRILIADDHPVIRRHISKTLQRQKDWEVCGEAATGREAVLLNAAQQPDLVVLDLSMPEMSGLEAAKLIHEQSPGTDIILMTMHEFFVLMEELHTLGIRTCVPKTELQELVNAVCNVHQSRLSSKLAVSAVPETIPDLREHDQPPSSRNSDGS